jgi:hypothetical protein
MSHHLQDLQDQMDEIRRDLEQVNEKASCQSIICCGICLSFVSYIAGAYEEQNENIYWEDLNKVLNIERRIAYYCSAAGGTK